MLREQLTKCIVLIIAGSCLARDAQIVDQWAENLGTELLELANAVGRPDELIEKYKTMNAIVVEKSGEELIDIISESVGRMLRRKMDAVRCILKVAEAAAEEYVREENENVTYVSGKYSNVIDMPETSTPQSIRRNYSTFRDMELTSDSHFYNIPVNTNYSSVHVPTNVWDLGPAVIEAIDWSEALDDIFRQNYKSDPALSWQYFGSTTGVLRQYPAMQWRTDRGADGHPVVDQYDCRTRSWFIEAATCSKDVVILVDVSGSMEGMGRTIAIATVSSILDTLSNNDFVTILQYTNETDEIVPCFKDKLIQATPENLKTFKEKLQDMDPGEAANLTWAFTRAFNLLKNYSDARGCDTETPCNQLIMLVTDGVASNVSEVFDDWNRQENGTRIPVRVFTYLLGREISMVQEIQLMACLNRGYYTHIKTQEEAREQVLKYIPVVARPLVLQGDVHPIVWTHVYADVTCSPPKGNPTRLTHNFSDAHTLKYTGRKTGCSPLAEGENPRSDPSKVNTTLWQEYRLLTSVSIPAFDRKGNRNNNTRKANLLGVAGTDVPIDDIRKLTLPYKLGVNGYAFIVSNNGYVILHPDLRPVSQGRLKLNYNSIDLTEVEILDDGRGPRDPGPEVLQLRAELVDHKRGSLKNIPVKLHYDDNRRVTLEKRDYYYAPLPGTPFGIAIAIPNYGKTWIKVEDEIRKTQRTNDLSDFFVGENWRVHPGWVYCRFHYLEGHEFENSETELKHFLRLLGRPDWKWSDQYEAYSNTSDNNEEPDCYDQVLHDDDYYCNQELMELLIFDAKATNKSYSGTFVHRDQATRRLANAWGVFLRFVATQSGLTRWQDLDVSKIPRGREQVKFGDLYRRAVNEPWYKGAIFQHEIDHDSISISVPWEAGPTAVVTVSMAIFPRDGGKNASAAVVGFQMPMTTFYQKFIDVTSTTTNPDMNCVHKWIDCYLIDQNGYVVISEAHNDTGRFLGVVEGAVMKSMVVQGFFKAVEIYDYQGLCQDYVIRSDASGNFGNPFRYVGKLLVWLLGRLLWMTTKFVNLPEAFARVHSDEDLPEPPPPPKEEPVPFACDQKRTLFIMDQEVAEERITNSSLQCSRPFYAQRVPATNLLLLVVDSMYWTCHEKLEVTAKNIDPSEYPNGTEPSPCHKKHLNDLPRRRLENCYAEHPLEEEIDACGRATTLPHFSIRTSLFILFIIKLAL
ncbi:voltage-dependent calcium channel subunit alpha-2/delta-3 isoform X2 [Venturia canescens]|uniref:voltage-dependent calcium channel subunit alpha-2/delta-3 isoform X2 n=1 Tax=Venturia canescens TaxID=32260 RepID=UPI001C9C4FC3|nr:voltage-dependent calcium channel subunit alpha-2/delta-3 isoform X2 [Venturia canescens]